MLKQPVARPALKLPRIIFGATSLGNLFTASSDKTKSDIVDAWFDSSASTVAIDTAGKYGAGLSLEVISRELLRKGIPPESLIISNKLGWRRIPLVGDAPTFEPEVWIDLKYDATQDISSEGILRCWEEGNQLLSPYRANYVSVHDPDEYLAAATSPHDRQRRLTDILDAYKNLIQLRNTGKVTSVGIGAKDWRTIQSIESSCQLDWIMFANSFTIMQHPAELVDYISDLRDRNKHVINSAIFHGGFLLGSHFLDYKPLDRQIASHAAAIKWRDTYNKICLRWNITPFQAGLSFALSHPGIKSIALSSTNPARIAEQSRQVETIVDQGFWLDLKQHQLISESYPHL